MNNATKIWRKFDIHKKKMEKISPIKERVLYFIEKQEVVKTHFCKNTGISYANLKGKGLYSEFGGGQIGKILSTYPEISAEWLLTGNGSMLKSKKELSTDDPENVKTDFEDDTEPGNNDILDEITNPKDLFSIIREKQRAIDDKDKSLKRVIRSSFSSNRDNYNIIKEKDEQIKMLHEQILSMSKQITELIRQVSESYKKA